MNCCNEYGKCTQGNNCPARSNPPDTDKDDDSELMYLVSIAMAIVGASATLGFIVGYSAHRFF